MTGKTQAEAVSFLRMLPEGSQVELVLSRQEEVDEKFRVPRKLVSVLLQLYFLPSDFLYSFLKHENEAYLCIL